MKGHSFYDILALFAICSFVCTLAEESVQLSLDQVVYFFESSTAVLHKTTFVVWRGWGPHFQMLGEFGTAGLPGEPI